MSSELAESKRDRDVFTIKRERERGDIVVSKGFKIEDPKI